jgi:hypothetical protein
MSDALTSFVELTVLGLLFNDLLYVLPNLCLFPLPFYAHNLVLSSFNINEFDERILFFIYQE